MYKLSSFTYGVIDSEDSAYLTNYGEKIIVDNSTSTNASRSGGVSTWGDVLLDIEEVYENYTLISSNNLPEFIAISEETIEQETGRYACSVSAMYACAMYYNVVDYYDMAGDYTELWNRSSTTTVKTEGGIIYSSTTRNNVGPAFEAYCASRALYLDYQFYSIPTFSAFKTCIDNNNIAIVHCAINVLEEGAVTRSGHSMTVEGYASLQGNNTGNTIRTLMVFDGWNEFVRYLNFDSEDFTELESTVFTYY